MNPIRESAGHLRKAPVPIMLTAAGIRMAVSALQPENTRSPMAVTLSGMVTPVSALQPENAAGPKSVTPSGIA